MDEVDLRICQQLLLNSRRTFRDLSQTLDLSVNAVHKRVQGLLERGIFRAFTTKLTIESLNAITILVFGKSGPGGGEEGAKRVAVGRSTFWYGMGGNDNLYLGAYLRHIGELDDYLELVRKEAKIANPVVGLVTYDSDSRAGSSVQSSQFLSSIGYNLSPLDYKILYSMAMDSRKNLLDVATEIHASAKTVKRRLGSMEKSGIIEYSAEWYPDGDNDVLTAFHLELAPERNKIATISLLYEKYSPNMCVIWNFSNMPHFLLCIAWAPTIKASQDFRRKLEGEGFSTVTPDVMFTGQIFGTWREELVAERTRAIQ